MRYPLRISRCFLVSYRSLCEPALIFEPVGHRTPSEHLRLLSRFTLTQFNVSWAATAFLLLKGNVSPDCSEQDSNLHLVLTAFPIKLSEHIFYYFLNLYKYYNKIFYKNQIVHLTGGNALPCRSGFFAAAQPAPLFSLF